MLKATDLLYQYPESSMIQSPNLFVDKNETLLIREVSGCGKTTLLNLLAGLLSSENGKINYNDPNEFYYILKNAVELDQQ